MTPLLVILLLFTLITFLYMNLDFTCLSNRIWQKFSLEFCQSAVEGVTGLFSERTLLCVEACQRAGHMLIDIVSLCERNRPETTKTCLQSEGIRHIRGSFHKYYTLFYCLHVYFILENISLQSFYVVPLLLNDRVPFRKICYSI